MKFSDIEKANWPELQPYLDTCLLPITGLTGDESPWEVTEALEKLRDLMDLVEIPFKGRVVTYPSMQYRMEAESLTSFINALCLKLKAAEFKHVIVITADLSISELVFSECDLLISAKALDHEQGNLASVVTSLVQGLWKSKD
ncbi:MAG: hypothetical protein JWM44_3948 [Bacilli bacterium]|jgi:23S rRNA (pseudouridine1915-N3)-methyltransferase|nr:hypothetical protein [Bacilli bacterium]